MGIKISYVWIYVHYGSVVGTWTLCMVARFVCSKNHLTISIDACQVVSQAVIVYCESLPVVLQLPFEQRPLIILVGTLHTTPFHRHWE